jgi:hypothetical protein
MILKTSRMTPLSPQQKAASGFSPKRLFISESNLPEGGSAYL